MFINKCEEEDNDFAIILAVLEQEAASNVPDLIKSDVPDLYEEEVKVITIMYKEKLYLKDEENLIYDCDSSEEIGFWDTEKQEVIMYRILHAKRIYYPAE